MPSPVEVSGTVDPKFSVHDFVWAKVQSSPPWPAIVMHPVSVDEVPLPKKAENVEDFYWVYFLGSQNYSWVRKDYLKDYEPFRDKYVSIHKKPAFKVAYEEMDRHVNLRKLVPTYVVENIVEFKGAAKKKSQRPKSSLGNHVDEYSDTKPKARPSSSLSNHVAKNKSSERPKSSLSNHIDDEAGSNAKKRPRSSLGNRKKPVECSNSTPLYDETGSDVKKRPRSSLGNKKKPVECTNSTSISLEKRGYTKRQKSSSAVYGSNKEKPAERPNSTPLIVESRGSTKRRRSSSAVSSGYNSIDTSPSTSKRRRKSLVRSSSGVSSEDTCHAEYEVPRHFPEEWGFMLDTQNIQASDKWIGVLGLGLIGRHVVRNLLRSGHKVNIWNRTAAKRDQLETEFRVAMGKTLFGFTNIQKLLRKSDIIFVCIAGYGACKEFVQENFGVNDTENTVLEGKSIVVLTNIDPESSKNIRDMVGEKGAKYLETQIQWGGIALEENLILFAAGDKSLFYECQSCFKAISTYAIFLGKVGYACMIMLIFQLVKGVLLGALNEALFMVKRFNIKMSDFVDILMNTDLSNDFIISKSLKMMYEEFRDVEQSLSNMQTDIKMGLVLSDMAGQPMSVMAIANEMFKHSCHLGYGDLDAAVIYLRNMH